MFSPVTDTLPVQVGNRPDFRAFEPVARLTAMISTTLSSLSCSLPSSRVVAKVKNFHEGTGMVARSDQVPWPVGCIGQIPAPHTDSTPCALLVQMAGLVHLDWMVGLFVCSFVPSLWFCGLVLGGFEPRKWEMLILVGQH